MGSIPLYITPNPNFHCLLYRIPSSQSAKLPKHIHKGPSLRPEDNVKEKLSHPKDTHPQLVMVSEKSRFPFFPPMTPPKPSGISNACPFLAEDHHNPLP